MSGIRISANLRLVYMRALFKQPVSEIDATSPGKISTRLTTNANTVQMGISQQFASLIQSMALFIGLYVTAFVKGPLLTLVASSSIPLSLIIYSFVVPFVFGNQKKSELFKEKASALAFEIFESIRIVAAFGAEDRLAKAHLHYLEQGREIDRKNAPLMGLMMAPMFFGMYATFALTFWFGIKQVTEGHLDGIGSITVVLFSVNFAASSIGRLVGPLMMMIRAASAAAEMFVTLDTPVPDMSGLSDPDVSALDEINFKDVEFYYPTRPDAMILKKLNVKFETGKTTAIVGPSGSGKSTIVGLIQRWYEPTKSETSIEETASAHDSVKEKSDTEKERGDSSSTALADISGVFIGTVPLNKVDVQWWRKNVGLVQQEPFLFNDTIFNNVANGLSGTKWNDAPKEEKMELVKNACRESFAAEYINKLPEVSSVTDSNPWTHSCRDTKPWLGRAVLNSAVARDRDSLVCPAHLM
jgi:ATP-binding cassette, subfamily B (MDR/TAP), member 1